MGIHFFSFPAKLLVSLTLPGDDVADFGRKSRLDAGYGHTFFSFPAKLLVSLTLPGDDVADFGRQSRLDAGYGHTFFFHFLRNYWFP